MIKEKCEYADSYKALSAPRNPKCCTTCWCKFFKRHPDPAKWTHVQRRRVHLFAKEHYTPFVKEKDIE